MDVAVLAGYRFAMARFAHFIAWMVLGAPMAVSAAERAYPIPDFERVRIIGPFAVTISPARATTARARGAALALDTVSIDVQDRTLIIQPVNTGVPSTGRNTTGPIVITVTTPRLASVKLTGSGSASIAELRGMQADLALTGGGAISVARVATDKLTVRLAGSGTIALTGKTLNLEADARGAGGIDATGLVASDLKLNAVSSGEIRMMASRSANVTSSGSGTVKIEGKAACLVQRLGVGTVDCGAQ